MTYQLATRFARSALTIGLGVLAACGTAVAAHAADAEAVTIDTTFTVKTPPVRLDRPAHPAHALHLHR